MVNTRPSHAMVAPIKNPVMVERATIVPAGPRIRGIVEKWDARKRFGFIFDPATDEKFYFHAAAIQCDESRVDEGISVEFSPTEGDASRMKGGTVYRRATVITELAEPLTVVIETYVLAVREKFGLLHNPENTNTHERGGNIFFPLYMWRDAIKQQDCVAHCVKTPRGWRATRVEPR